jgi:hypothetical protein
VPDLWAAADYFAAHPYAFGNVPFGEPGGRAGVENYRAELQAVGRPDLAVAVTETGWAGTDEAAVAASMVAAYQEVRAARCMRMRACCVLRRASCEYREPRSCCVLRMVWRPAYFLGLRLHAACGMLRWCPAACVRVCCPVPNQKGQGRTYRHSLACNTAATHTLPPVLSFSSSPCFATRPPSRPRWGGSRCLTRLAVRANVRRCQEIIVRGGCVGG